MRSVLQDIPWVEEAVQEQAAKLLVLDPLMPYLDVKVNTWKERPRRFWTHHQR